MRRRRLHASSRARCRAASSANTATEPTSVSGRRPADAADWARAKRRKRSDLGTGTSLSSVSLIRSRRRPTGVMLTSPSSTPAAGTTRPAVALRARRHSLTAGRSARGRPTGRFTAGWAGGCRPDDYRSDSAETRSAAGTIRSSRRAPEVRTPTEASAPALSPCASRGCPPDCASPRRLSNFCGDHCEPGAGCNGGTRERTVASDSSRRGRWYGPGGARTVVQARRARGPTCRQRWLSDVNRSFSRGCGAGGLQEEAWTVSGRTWLRHPQTMARRSLTCLMYFDPSTCGAR